MAEQFFRYVLVERVEDYRSIGWEIIGRESFMYKGEMVMVMEWQATGLPATPEEVAARRGGGGEIPGEPYTRERYGD